MVGNKVLALDVGGTNMRAAIVSRGKILNYEKIDTPKDKKLFLMELENLISRNLRKECRGIGIGFPGIVQEGVVFDAPNLPLKKYHLKRHLQEKFRKKVEIANDASCVGLAEHKYGVKKKNILVLTLGTGIGGGLVIDGKNYSGGGYATEFGHMLIKGRDFEEHWKKTKKRVRRELKGEVYFSKIISRKPKKARKIIEDAADYFGQGVASLMCALDPDVVVMAGGVKECGSFFLDPIKKKTYEYYFFDKKIPIFWSKLKEPGILGASLLVG